MPGIRPNTKPHYVAKDYFFCSQLWFPTVQEVLHADWQEVWHSPHPPFFTDCCRFLVLNVLMCFISYALLSYYLSHSGNMCSYIDEYSILSFGKKVFSH